jgi:hypothetical protein
MGPDEAPQSGQSHCAESPARITESEINIRENILITLNVI